MDRISSVLAGYQESLLPEVQRYWLSNLPYVQEPVPTPEQPKLKQQRVQVGWIEERRANPKRENPTTCYYFCWYEMQDGIRRKLKTYVPQVQMSEVWQSVKVNKRPYYATLKLIRKSGKLHHTDEPKL